MKNGSHSQQLKWSMGTLKKGGRLISQHRNTLTSSRTPFGTNDTKTCNQETKISMYKIYLKPFQAINVAQCPSSLKSPHIDFNPRLILTRILTLVTTFAICENTETFLLATDQCL